MFLLDRKTIAQYVYISFGPSGGNGTTSFMGRLGYCADVLRETNRATAANRTFTLGPSSSGTLA